MMLKHHRYSGLSAYRPHGFGCFQPVGRCFGPWAYRPLRPFVKIVDVQASEKSKAAGEPPLRSNEDLYRYFSERERRSGGNAIEG